MIIKLTNSLPTLRGQPILLNSEIIVSVLRVFVNRDDGVIEEVTMVNSSGFGSWEVKEDIEEIYNLIQGDKTI